MSDSQTLTTCQPDLLSRRVVFLSRRMLLDIFAHQYAAFVPLVSFLLRLFHFRPCQKSPSQNTARRALENTMSGQPGRLVAFFLKRSPNLESSLRNATSWRVLRLVFAFLIREDKGEAGLRPAKEGALLCFFIDLEVKHDINGYTSIL